MIFDLHTHTNLSSCAAKENTWESLLDKAESENIKPLIVSDKLIKLKQAIDKYIKVNNN